MNKDKKTKYGFDLFLSDLMNNITNPVTLFVFPPFVIFHLLSLSEVNENIKLSTEKYEWLMLPLASYALYFSYLFFGIIFIFSLLNLVKSWRNIKKLKYLTLKILGGLLIIIIGIGFFATTVWMINVIEAHAKNTQTQENTISE